MQAFLLISVSPYKLLPEPIYPWFIPLFSPFPDASLTRETLISHISQSGPISSFTRKAGSQSKTIAPASTFQFVPKNDPLPEAASTEGHGIPPGTHWVDWAQPETIVMIDQPAGQNCAAVGGIMALRMKALGVKAAVVNGRMRDLEELQETGLPVSREKAFLSTSPFLYYILDYFC